MEGLQDAVRTDEQLFVFIGVHLGDGRQTGGFVAEVIVQGINRLADAFPNGRLVVLKNTDHFATPESFAFIDALLEFMA